MSTDVRGVPVSHSNAQADDAFERGLRALQTFRGDPTQPFDEAIAHAPDFAAAHAAKALVLMTFFERRFARQALAALQVGAGAIARGTPREQALANAARLLAEGDWHGAVAALDRILVEHPRDVLALQVAHLVDFLRGDSLNLRNRVSRVLPHWSSAVPGQAYVLGMHAFGLEECNQYAEAEETGLRSLAQAPDDCWAVHAVTHVFEMQGRIEEGVAFLEKRRADWATQDNGFAFHNWWHLALLHMDHAGYDRALAIYDERIAGNLEMAMSRLDATSMLWRLQLEGVDVASRWGPVADAWEASLAEEGGFYAFNDFHAALAFAATGRGEAIEQVRATLRRSLCVPGANAEMARRVGIDASEAAIAYCEGRFASAAEMLVDVRDGASRFGGSHAQRDVLTLTLVDAARRAGKVALARHFASERIVHKPHARWGRRLMMGTYLQREAA